MQYIRSDSISIENAHNTMCTVFEAGSTRGKHQPVLSVLSVHVSTHFGALFTFEINSFRVYPNWICVVPLIMIGFLTVSS